MRRDQPEYRSWQMMKNRCLNPLAEDWDYYGGKGITVCERWLDYENFIADMGRQPAPGYTLERKETSKNYEPSNCEWASRLTQSRNRPYAKRKAWLLAEILGVSMSRASNLIWIMRARDAGKTTRDWMSKETERIVRQHIVDTES